MYEEFMVYVKLQLTHLKENPNSNVNFSHQVFFHNYKAEGLGSREARVYKSEK